MIGLLARPLTPTDFLAHCAPAISLLPVLKTGQNTPSYLWASAGSFCLRMPLGILLACCATSLSLFACHFLRETDCNHLQLQPPVQSPLHSQTPFLALFFYTAFITIDRFYIFIYLFILHFPHGMRASVLICFMHVVFLEMYLEMPGRVDQYFSTFFLSSLPTPGVSVGISSNYSSPRKFLILQVYCLFVSVLY